MRITRKMMTSRMLTSIASNRELFAKLQMDIATTKKMRRPSDDPAAVAQAQAIKEVASKNDQYLRNMTAMRDSITTAAAATDTILDQLEKAKSIASQGGTGTINAEARATLAMQVDQIIDTVIDMGNTNSRGRSLFAGTLTAATPYTRSGDAITYNGNDKNIELKIGHKTTMAYNKTGNDIFNPPGGVDIFAELVALKQGLESDDGTAILNTISTLNSSIDQVLGVSSQFGLKQEQLSSTEIILESENLKFADTVSKIEDTDMVEALVNSQILENAINVGLKTMADVVQTSLLDFVR